MPEPAEPSLAASQGPIGRASGASDAPAGRPIAARPVAALGPVELAVAALVAVAVIWAPLPIEVRWLGTFALLVVLPGWLLVRLALPPSASIGRSAGIGRIERGLLALGAGYVLAMLVGLAVVVLFRPAAGGQITALAAGLVLALAAIGAWRSATRRSQEPEEPSPSGRGQGEGVPSWRLAPFAALGAGSGAWPLVFVVAVAGVLRLADLGWSEFQGDEARILLRAMAALQGAPDALAAHRKVPGEILLTLAFYGQLGAMTELVGRLLFALAGVAGVAAFSVLARELLGPRAGLVAALLMAVNGYFVAFGRILQYDSLAFLLGTLGLLCCHRFARAWRPTEPPYEQSREATAEDAAGHAVEDASGHAARARAADAPAAHAPVAGLALLGSLCLFGAVMVALGAVFFVPPALVLLAPALRHVRRLPARVFVAALWPIVPGLLAVGLVLWPGGAGEGTGGGVWSYLGPRLGGSRPYWNLDAFLRSANHYLSTPYLAVTLAGAAVFVLDATRRHLSATGVRGALVRLAAALGVAALAWDRPLTAGALAACVLVGALIVSSRVALGGRVALAWAAGPLLVHLFLVRFSGTHWREAFPGLALLAAVVLVAGMQGRWARGRWARARWTRGVVVAGLAVVLVGTAHYDWVTLVRRWPEYQMTFPRDRHLFDLTDGTGRGIGGVFGVAHRHGWKAVGVLTAEGALAGSYATNESPAIAAWYVRRPQGCPEPPALVFRVPRAPQDRNLGGPVPLPEGYVAGGRVLVGDHSGVTILVTPGAGQPGDVQSGDLESRFDQDGATSPWRPIGPLYGPDLGAAAARRACGGA